MTAARWAWRGYLAAGALLLTGVIAAHLPIGR